MLRKWAVVGMVLSGLMAGVVGAGADETKIEGDLKSMQGAWIAPSGDGGEVLYTFKGKTLVVTAPTRTYEMTVTLNPMAKPEKSIDLKIDKAPEDAMGKQALGIYKLEGEEKLVICFRVAEGRPEKFEMQGFEQFVVELKRKKAEKAPG